MEKITKKATEMLEDSLAQIANSQRDFYADNPIMLKILDDREKVLKYLLRLCKKDIG
jgi:hypothetical protein